MNRRGIQRWNGVAVLVGLALLAGASFAQTTTDPSQTSPKDGADRQDAQQDIQQDVQQDGQVSRPREKWQPAKRIIDVQVTAARQSDYVRDMIRQGGGSDVPVLLPYSMTKDETTAKAYRMEMRVRRDDYTVVLHEPHMDIVIIGTSRYFPGERGIRTDRQDDYIMPYERFTDGEGGAFSFGKFGADYLVEFYCLPLENGKDNPCMDEAGARAFINEMMSGG